MDTWVEVDEMEHLITNMVTKYERTNSFGY